ncbi:Las17-binding protein actin regulator [Salinihabitans flavidus]|uniref:Las17-binding protein actin regulator n=1 Tax=Salinihabitans flavidus TaxID=569882 RepID=A0A1H8NII0_9RHOB|nr:YSC84-related protein [Salinihabitans flavidus]SEO29430.1 Las17-binding protein actin regulator [Salinihabitans flavidus]
MSIITTRRAALTGLASLGLTAACGNGIGSRGPAEIDARVQTTLNHMYSNYPGTVDLKEKSAGMLVMPLVTEAGFGFGGGYGRGALLVDDVTVDYYSSAKANFGFQIGAQQYAHVLFFMTQEALSQFRRSSGWAVGGDAEFVVLNEGNSASADTTTVLSPVIGVIFGRAGLRAGLTLEGTKYTRVIP